MKRILSRIIVFSIAILHYNGLAGQFYSTGEAPASITWKQILSSHFNIVFPSEWEQNAQKLTVLLEKNYSAGMGDLQRPLRKKFPVLVHSSSLLSNGYVTLAPGRMEIVTPPPQDSYAQDWLSQVTLHEFRHVVQLNKLNQGFTRVSGWFTGEVARGIVSSQIPPWFYEGDAVYNETFLSEAGRGRLPSFEMPLRAILLNQPGLYSYNKAVFGSFRDFVPNQYQYGYPMVQYARLRYGTDVWSRALDYASRNPFLIWPLSFHLMHNYGIDKSGLYQLSMKSLKEQYNNEKRQHTYTKYGSINHRRDSVFTSWLLPRAYGNSIVAVKNGWKDPGSFVLIDSLGKERRLLSLGNSAMITNDLFGDLIVWDELIRDPRWERRDYSIIRSMNIKTGKKVQLTRKSRYLSPDFSPDGSRIAVVENNTQGKNFLIILDATTGKALQRIPAGDKELLTPEWAGTHEILVITITAAGKQLEAVNTDTEGWKVYIPCTRIDIAEPLNYNNYILFRGSFQNTDQLFAIHKTSPGVFHQVTHAVFGVRQASIDTIRQELLFSEYGIHGYDICRIPIDTIHWSIPDLKLPDERTKPDTGSADTGFGAVWPVKPYRKSGHLFSVHSWMPFYTDLNALLDDPFNVSISPGFMLFSQNLLSTVISSIGYGYNQGYHQLRPSLIWRGWFPVIEVEGVAGGPADVLSLPPGAAVPKSPIVHELSVKSYIPLIYYHGSYVTQIQPRLEYQWTSTWYDNEGVAGYGLDYLHLKFTASRIRRFAFRDLYPRMGQTLAVSYTRPITNTGQFGTLFSMQAGLYLPGFFSHHHVIIRGGFQEQFPQKYLLPIIRVSFPRGYTDAVARKTAGLMVNYAFPVAYPDLSVGPVLYLKRIRATLFYDTLYGYDIREFDSDGVDRYTGYYRSYGVELISDLHLLRIIFPFSAGIRMGYMQDKSTWFTEILMSVNTRLF